jgi:RNA polymerase sigma-70 factor (ECF subfamily)
VPPPRFSRFRSPNPALDDVQLVLRIQQGDADAFAAFYDRHARAVYGLAHRIVRSAALAEDVTQETFVSFWRARDAFAGERGAAASWLLGIARNRAIDVTRRPSHRRDHPLEADFDQEAPESTELEVLRRVDATAIADALGVLPPGQRQVIELAYADGLSQVEIATRLALPLGTVKSRARLGLTKLRAELSGSGAFGVAAAGAGVMPDAAAAVA